MPIELEKITEKELTTKGVVALADKPNSVSQVSHKYGQASLSPEKLKAWFDALPRLLADRINKIIDHIGELDDALFNRVITGCEDGTIAVSMQVPDPRGQLYRLTDILAKAAYIPYHFYFNNVSSMLEVLRAGCACKNDVFVFLTDDEKLPEPMDPTEYDEAVYYCMWVMATGVEAEKVRKNVKKVPIEIYDSVDFKFEFGKEYYLVEAKTIVFLDNCVDIESLEDGDVFCNGEKLIWLDGKVEKYDNGENG